MMYTNLWYVAEQSERLADEPLRVRMLGRDFVLFRAGDGKVACLSDVCPHRGSSLARGRCDADGTVRCPFHGWSFDAAGHCTRIPSQADPERDVPPGAKVDAYPVEERYGLIWVFLGDDPEGALPIPDIAEYDDPDWRGQHYADTWHANLHWSKMTDLDHVHLPVVHGIDFGGDNPNRPPAHQVELFDGGFRTEIRGHTPPSARSFKEYEGKRSGAVSKLAFYLSGFTLRGQVWFAGEAAGMCNLFYEISTPIDEERTRMYYLFFRNFYLEPKNDAMHVQRNLKNVFQDKANAESIMPKRAPDVDDWPVLQLDREDLLMSTYWDLMRQLRHSGYQIDRVALNALDANGDYRVIPSPGRRENPDGWVFDTVPRLAAGFAERQRSESRRAGIV
jgi:phenylpropionate dioxygenase-like ring-hydroxylating dioxygenase large terminal subunit